MRTKFDWDYYRQISKWTKKDTAQLAASIVASLVSSMVTVLILWACGKI